MAKRTPTTYGGSAAMFPTSDRTPVQKLARLRSWIAAYTEYAQDRNPVQAAKARKQLKKFEAVEAVLLIAIKSGQDYCEMRGLIETEGIAA